MATSCFYAASSISSDAYFRAWGLALSDAMTAVGFLKTSDTGQIDWTTATAPTAATTYAGYEIRVFSDTLQSSNPVYVKIQYGSGSGASYSGVKIQLGRGSDGAGNLDTSKIITASLLASTNNASLTSMLCIVSGDTNRIEVAMFTSDLANYNFAFWIERTKDSSGAVTDAGVDFGVTTGGTPYQLFFPKEGNNYPITATIGLPCLLPYGNQSLSLMGNVGVFPICTDMGYVSYPNLAAIVFKSTSMASFGSILSISILGSTHKFILTSVPVSNVNGSSTNLYLAMRYE